jgi:hypothetical protein
MADRSFLFSNEIAGALGVPNQIVAHLHRYGYLRDARMEISGGCAVVYDADRVHRLRTALSEGGELAGTIVYLEAIERED